MSKISKENLFQTFLSYSIVILVFLNLLQIYGFMPNIKDINNRNGKQIFYKETTQNKSNMKTFIDKPLSCNHMKNSDSSPTQEVLTLKGFIRGHKCLLDDSKIPNGNLVFLLRGADASQRLLFPLEIESNKKSLKGANVALKMFELSEQAINFSNEAIFKTFKDIDPKSIIGEILKEDMNRYHRILQYSVAAGLTNNFLRLEALKYNLELYDEIDMNYLALEKGVWSFKEFYQMNLKQTEFNQNFLPSWTTLWDQISLMKNYTSKKSKNISNSINKFEDDPEPGTLSTLHVNIKNLNLDEFPDSSRHDMETFLKQYK